MNTKKLAGIVLIIAGVILFAIGSNIKTRVADGRIQIEEGQRKVDTVNTLFSVDPATKEFGKELTKSGQKEIDQGTRSANYYENMANILQISGVVAFILGAVSLALSGRKGKSK